MYIEAAAFIILNVPAAGGVDVAEAGLPETVLCFTSCEKLGLRGVNTWKSLMEKTNWERKKK